MKRCAWLVIWILLTACAWGQGGAAISTAYVPRADVLVTRQNRVVNAYSAAANSDAARGAALANAVNSSQAGDTIACGAGSYALSSQLAIKDNQHWTFNGTQLTSAINDQTLILASGKSGWSITGPLRIVGHGGGSGIETGIAVTECHRWRLNDVEALDWNGFGYDFQPDTTTFTQRLNGRCRSLYAQGCATGIRVQARSEYSTYESVECKSCALGADIAGGNNRFTDLSVTDNVNGCVFRGGNNHLHGYVQGMTANHNTGFGITFAAGIDLGLRITNLFLYGNSTTTGGLVFDNCKGVVINGGHLGGPILFTATPSGYNTISNMLVVDSPIGGTVTATPQQRRMLKIESCWDTAGPWSGCDPVSAASGGTGAASLPAGTIPFVETATGRMLGDAVNFSRNPVTGRTTMRGPVDLFSGMTGGDAGSLTVRAGHNALVPFVVRGTSDTVSPSVYPGSLSPALWVRAAGENFVHGQTVTSLTDLSGNARHMTNPGGAASPPCFVAGALNGKPAIRFAASAPNYFDSPSFSLSNPFTLFAVFKQNTAGNQVLCTAGNAATAMVYNFNGTKGGLNASGSDLDVSMNSANWNILEAVFNGGSSSGRVNGGTLATGNPGSGAFNSTFRIGAYSNGSFTFAGDLAELILFPGGLTGAQLEGVRQYLASEYALSITQGTAGAASAQTADLIQVQDAGGGVVMSWDARGIPVLPTYTTTTRDALVSPKTRSLIFNSTTGKLNYFDGTAWQAVTSN